MALAEYELDGRTYLFDKDSAPDKAVKVGDVDPKSTSVVLFPDQAAEKPKSAEPAKKAAKATPANKAGRQPENKADKPADEESAKD